ncbi:MAG TPA: gluconate 2-dehydrogenase subunit 3 family protein [Bryobacteraceae bacterium]|nr:gluconate 2-dehydrogenase subunit 3 family protein [Bryobacteraceae bacterium]
MSELSRRDLLQSIALSVTLGGLSPAAAQHVHSLAAEEKTSTGVYKAKALNPHEYQTLDKLADLIVPADEKSPGAVASGACEFIDLLASQNPRLLEIYTGGIAWLDQSMKRRYSTDFVSAKPGQQTALLDQVAYRKNESPELGPGILFFDWARRMVVDAYYTSPAGIKAIGYMGNTSVSKFELPQEAIEYAVKRSPV